MRKIIFECDSGEEIVEYDDDMSGEEIDMDFHAWLVKITDADWYEVENDYDA